jgi:hypothetical protein
MGGVNNSIDKFGRQKVSGNLRGQLMRGPPGIGFKLTKWGNFDIEGKRICNVGEPIDRSDAVTLGYLKTDLSECVAQTQEAINEAVLVSHKHLREANEKEIKMRLEEVFDQYLKHHQNEILKMVSEPIVQTYEQMRITTEKLIQSRYSEATEEIKKLVHTENVKLRQEFKEMLAAENAQLFLSK